MFAIVIRNNGKSVPYARRYMMQWPGGRILQRHELDAFLAQAVSNQLYEPDQLQELKVSVQKSKLDYSACILIVVL